MARHKKLNVADENDDRQFFLEHGRPQPKSAVGVQQKFAEARAAMQSALVERDEEIDLVLVALICKENPLLVGPPGTAKSLLLDTLAEWLDVPRFSYLLTMFTDPSEIFGPVDLNALKAGQCQRNVQGFVPTAGLVFLDEIFKASSAILNTLLKVLNEKTFKYGQQELRCPLALCVAASNEWPQEQEALGALFDRFLLRKTVKPVSPRQGRRELLRRADEGDNCRAHFKSRLTQDELQKAHQEAMALPLSVQAKKDLWKILEELDKEGIRPGDRRLTKCVAVIRAAAYLRGSQQVETQDLEVLCHVLWDDPGEQPEKAGKVIRKIANPSGMKVTELLVQMEQVLDKSNPAEASAKLQEIRKELEGLPEGTRRDKALAYCQSCIRSVLNKAIGVKEDN